MTDIDGEHVRDEYLPHLSDDNKRFLLTVAREAVENHVKSLPVNRLLYYDTALKQGWGAFVTLKIRGNLRGCIGTITSNKPIPETIAELAVKSAAHDPRFPPIGPAELEELGVEISILGPIREVHNIDEIQVGRDGLVIEYYGRHGLLLPQVATEHGLDLHEFLAQTCLKAGLPQDSWKHGARIFRFSAEVF